MRRYILFTSPNCRTRGILGSTWIWSLVWCFHAVQLDHTGLMPPCGLARPHRVASVTRQSQVSVSHLSTSPVRLSVRVRVCVCVCMWRGCVCAYTCVCFVYLCFAEQMWNRFEKGSTEVFPALSLSWTLSGYRGLYDSYMQHKSCCWTHRPTLRFLVCVLVGIYINLK